MGDKISTGSSNLAPAKVPHGGRGGSPWKWQAALPGWSLGCKGTSGGWKVEKEEAEGALGSGHRGWVSWAVQSGLHPEGPGEPWTDGGS